MCDVTAAGLQTRHVLLHELTAAQAQTAVMEQEAEM